MPASASKQAVEIEPPHERKDKQRRDDTQDRRQRRAERPVLRIVEALLDRKADRHRRLAAQHVRFGGGAEHQDEDQQATDDDAREGDRHFDIAQLLPGARAKILRRLDLVARHLRQAEHHRKDREGQIDVEQPHQGRERREQDTADIDAEESLMVPARMPPFGIKNRCAPNSRTLSAMNTGTAIIVATIVANRPAWTTRALAIGQEISIVRTVVASAKKPTT